MEFIFLTMNDNSSLYLLDILLNREKREAFFFHSFK